MTAGGDEGRGRAAKEACGEANEEGYEKEASFMPIIARHHCSCVVMSEWCSTLTSLRLALALYTDVMR